MEGDVVSPPNLLPQATSQTLREVRATSARRRAVWLHDCFNFVVLPPLALMAALSLKQDRDEQVRVGHVASVYMALDCCIVALWPACVASPRFILMHHFAVLYLLRESPLRDRGPHRTAAMLLVEFNTILLLARRHLPKRGFLLELLFYASWAAFRVAVPLLVLFEVVQDLAASRTTFMDTRGCCIYTALVGLQLKWTFDLVRRLTLRASDRDDGL